MSRTTATIPSLPRAAAFLTAASGVALAIALTLNTNAGVGAWTAAVVLAVLGSSACLMQERLSRLTSISITDLPMVAAMLTLRPGPAMLVAFAAGAAWRGRLGLLSRVVNMNVLMIPMGVSCAAFAAMRSASGATSVSDAPIAWFVVAAISASVYQIVHLGLGGVWTRLAYGMPIRQWCQEVVLPVLKADPFSSLLVVSLVEVYLLLHGSARGLPLLLAVVAGAGIWWSVRSARQQIEVRELKDQFFRAIFVSLARLLEMKDPETAKHSARVAVFSRDIAEVLGLTREEQARLHLAGLLHDVGKVGVPDEILLKPGRLTPEERTIMETHSRLSAEAIAGIPGFSDLTRMVYAHHERLDGSGYPDGISGDAVPFGARILGVADTFEALTSDRPYRKGRNAIEALRVFEEESHLFDSEVVAALRWLVTSGSLDNRSGGIAEFSDEWSRAARHLDVRLDDEPFEMPPPRPRDGGAEPDPVPERPRLEDLPVALQVG